MRMATQRMHRIPTRMLSRILDKDDDNDGELTLNESADKNKDGNPADAHDMDADNIPDYLDDKEVPTVVLHAVLLQGAYSTADGLMRDDLRQRGFIPLAQPYADRLTSFKYRGTETAGRHGTGDYG